MSHYETLGVAKDADMPTIKKAWRRKASKAHTDRGGGDHTQMVAVNRAYETLSDRKKRARYDQTGDDRPIHSLDAKAMELIMQVFGQMLDQAHDTQDVIGLTRHQLRTTLSEIETKRVNTGRQIEALERKRKRLGHKGEKVERNFLDDLIAQRIAQLNHAAEQMGEAISTFKRGIELLDDYTYTQGKATEVGAIWKTYVYSGTGSR